MLGQMRVNGNDYSIGEREGGSKRKKEGTLRVVLTGLLEFGLKYMKPFRRKMKNRPCHLLDGGNTSSGSLNKNPALTTSLLGSLYFLTSDAAHASVMLRNYSSIAMHPERYWAMTGPRPQGGSEESMKRIAHTIQQHK
jgi:hypothetical protein